MFKNNLPISTLLGILIISIGGYLLTIRLELLIRENTYVEITDLNTIIVLSITIVSILIGVGLILKLNWVRHFFATVLTGFLLVLVVVFISNLSSTHSRFILSNIAGAIVVGFIYFFFIFLLYNRKVSEEFGIKHKEKDLEDILDFQE